MAVFPPKHSLSNFLNRAAAGLCWLRHNGLRAGWRKRRCLLARLVQLFIPPRRGYAPETDARILARAAAMRGAMKKFRSRPRISLAVAVSAPPAAGLPACIASVLAQVYPDWELILAPDSGGDASLPEFVENLRRGDPRVTVAPGTAEVRGKSALLAALGRSTGEYFCLLGGEDRLAPDALFEVARAIDGHPDADWLYSDEDRIDDAGVRSAPWFKPDWSPDLLTGCPYTGRLSVYRTALLRGLGELPPDSEGWGEHDLALRAAERAVEIHHIPRVLYHRGGPAGAVPEEPAHAECAAGENGAGAVQKALDRRGEGGRAEPLPGAPGLIRVSYPVRGEPLVSVVIPTRDGADDLRTCLESLFAVTGYRNFEVLIVDNGSVEAATFAIFREFGARHPERFRVERLDIPFNFSRLNNHAAALARGELLLLLNSDTEVIEPSWLEVMVGQAQRPSVGFVGAMLLYPDGTIQHAGVVLGIGGVAGHSHKYLPGDARGYFGRLKVASNYSAATAACLMVRSAVYREVGGMDEDFTVAFNDVDFCLRIRALGLLGVVVPDARLVHHESKSRGAEDTPDKIRRFHGEIARMQSRWGGILRADPYYNPNLSREREDFSLASDDVDHPC